MNEISGIEATRVRTTPDGRLTRENAAAFLGIAPRTLANWKSKGRGPKQTRIGGRVFYRLEDLRGFIDAGGRC